MMSVIALFSTIGTIPSHSKVTFRFGIRVLLLDHMLRGKVDARNEKHLHFESLRVGESILRVSGSVDICQYVGRAATRIPASG